MGVGVRDKVEDLDSGVEGGQREQDFLERWKRWKSEGRGWGRLSVGLRDDSDEDPCGKTVTWSYVLV